MCGTNRCQSCVILFIVSDVNRSFSPAIGIALPVTKRGGSSFTADDCPVPDCVIAILRFVLTDRRACQLTSSKLRGRQPRDFDDWPDFHRTLARPGNSSGYVN